MIDRDTIELLESSDLFDEDWYAATYPEVRDLRVSPQEHYLRIGASLGRDPGPVFSTSCYLADSPDVAVAGVNPLVHYLNVGRSEGRVPRRAGDRPEPIAVEAEASSPADTSTRTHPGHVPRRADRQLVLVVGHLAGASLFGAERSLLGLLDALDAIGFDAVVALPSDENRAYVEAVSARSSAVHVMSVPTRHPRRQPDADVVRDYVRLIGETGAAAVHVNTIVPREPSVAAREMGIPTVVHVREIAEGDAELEHWLDAPAEEIVASVLADADYVIATSRAVADAYPLSGRTAVVPNTVDPALFDLPSERGGDIVRVALIGSVHPKKGLHEFVEIARLLSSIPSASFHVIGPISPSVHELVAQGLPSNIEFAGAASDPVEALSTADVVVNLSTVSEAFGRTVLEAMTAGRPVVVVARGGLPELVRDGVCGFVVPADDLTLFAHRVGQLIDDVSLRQTMGEAGRRIACEEFSPAAMASKLATAYRAILPSAMSVHQSARDVSIALPMDNRSTFDRPYYINNRARFAWCTSVAFVGPDLLVCASLLGMHLHLVRFDRDARVGEVIYSLPTSDGEQEVTVDLLDHDGDGRLLTANCERSTLSTYRVVDEVIEFVDMIRLPDDRGSFCHGAAFVPGRSGVVCATTITGLCEAVFISMTEERRLGSFGEPGWVVKDAAFGDNGSMVLGLMNNPVGRDANSRHESKLVLISIGDEVTEQLILDQFELPGLTVDGCCVHKRLMFAACQSDDAILVFDLSDDRFTRLPDLLGFSFPHDVAVSTDGEWIAVANYGTNDVQLRPMPDELVARLRRSPVAPNA